VIVHVCTVKGKGYEEAEKEPHLYHGVSKPGKKVKSFTDYFGEEMCEIAGENEKVVAISPSMVASCGLQSFRNEYPDRLYDVGIAEAHATTFAAGMAQKGFVPVVAVYSSFLQRAYDSIMHDVALGGRHVVFAVDRAGIVGEDGETHQGIYDLSFLTHIPGMAVLAPCDGESLKKMLRYAALFHKGPIAVRYPKGCAQSVYESDFQFGKAHLIYEGDMVTIAALGSMVGVACKAADVLKEQGINAEVIDIRCAKPIDFDMIFKSAEKTGLLITIEDNIISGGVGEKIKAKANEYKKNFAVITKGFADGFVPAGKKDKLFEIHGLDCESIVKEIKESVKMHS